MAYTKRRMPRPLRPLLGASPITVRLAGFRGARPPRNPETMAAVPVVGALDPQKCFPLPGSPGPGTMAWLVVASGLLSTRGYRCDSGKKESSADVAFAGASHSTSGVKRSRVRWFLTAIVNSSIPRTTTRPPSGLDA